MANPTVLAVNDPSAKVDLVPTTTGIAAGTYTTAGLPCSAYSSVILQATTANITGTVQIYLQTLLPDGSTWCDIAAFSLISTATTRVMSFVSGGNAEFAKVDAALTAGTFNIMPLGSVIRLKYVVATNPTDLTVAAEFFV